MAGPMSPAAPMQQDTQQPAAPQGAAGSREVSPHDKKLAADYLKRIDAAKDRPATKEALKRFERNRKLLQGKDPDRDGAQMRSNLHFANLAMMRPQVYAKDPEYSIKVSNSVPEGRVEAAKMFASTAETVLQVELVKGCKLKKRAKRLLSSAFTTSVGWWKLCFQEDKRTDPLVANQIKDTTDELMRLQAMRQELDDPSRTADADLHLAKLNATLEGLRSNSEVTVSRGLVLDFVLSEDMLVLDDSVRELGEYERSAALAQRVWMTRAKYREWAGYNPSKGKTYREKTGSSMLSTDGSTNQGSNQSGNDSDLLAVWEVWDQETNRVSHVCEGEEGFCVPPTSPDWTGERWFPFFLLMFNEVDGAFYPLSDIELTEPLVREYNEARDDLVRDRRDSRPFTVVRKGGSLTEADVRNVRNRDGNDVILIEGVGTGPIANDLQAISLGRIDAANYNTQPARADMEMIIGGGDAARGSVLEAKTATEAEILSQGLRGRSAERQDIMEDFLTDVGAYSLQVLLRKLTVDEVRAIAGEDAQWPQITGVEEIFRMVSLDVRGGSTGKPDRLQDQDRWTKLLPVIEKTVQQVAELRTQGQDALAGALVELTRETLRRFDERLDIEQFLPPAKADGQADPQQLAQENAQLKQKLQQLMDEHKALQEQEEKAFYSTAATLATSATPSVALQAFQLALQVLDAHEKGEDGPQLGGMEPPEGAEQPEPGEPPEQAEGAMPAAGTSPIAMAAMQAAQAQPAAAPDAAMPPQSGMPT